MLLSFIWCVKFFFICLQELAEIVKAKKAAQAKVAGK